VLMELGDFAMMRRMLRGIKERAEALVKATWFNASTTDAALPTADSMSGRQSDVATADAARFPTK
jgi:hypothetical protein